jgi:hypothetical protein
MRASVRPSFRDKRPIARFLSLVVMRINWLRLRCREFRFPFQGV